MIMLKKGSLILQDYCRSTNTGVVSFLQTQADDFANYQQEDYFWIKADGLSKLWSSNKVSETILCD